MSLLHLLNINPLSLHPCMLLSLTQRSMHFLPQHANRPVVQRVGYSLNSLCAYNRVRAAQSICQVPMTLSMFSSLFCSLLDSINCCSLIDYFLYSLRSSAFIADFNHSRSFIFLLSIKFSLVRSAANLKETLILSGF